MSKARITAATLAVVLTSLASYATQKKAINVHVLFPKGRDISRIESPADFIAEDFSALRPDGDNLHYYYERIQTPEKGQARPLIKTEMYFITLLPFDYYSVDRFATRVFGPVEGNTTVDSIMKAMPNFMAFLNGISVGEIKRKVRQSGRLQMVELQFTLSDEAIAERYPTLAGKMKGHLDYMWFDLRNLDDEQLLRLDYSNNVAKIGFILDPKGYLIPVGQDGTPVEQGGHGLGLENAREGVSLYLDVGFRSHANLLKIFKILTVELNNMRVAVDVRQYDDRLAIAWKVIDVSTGKIQATGLDAGIIRDSLLLLKDSLNGTIEFMPAHSEGHNMTFMRVFATSEQIDNWLVHLALITWEQFGSEALTDLSIPVSEAILAFRRDVILQEGGNPHP